MRYLFVSILFLSIWGCQFNTKIEKDDLRLEWEEIKPIPSGFGNISKGVSAAFVGLIDDNLYVAGGCNFPDTPAAEGGKKVYYKDILMFDGSHWAKVGELPEALAYGISFSYNNAIYFVGGQNDKSKNTFYRLTNDFELKIEVLPSLPVSFDNGAGAMLGNKIVIVGGNQAGKASSDVWSFDLPNGENWEKDATLPLESGLVQSVAVSQNLLIRKDKKEFLNQEFYTSVKSVQTLVFGGFSPVSDVSPAKVKQHIFAFNDFRMSGWEDIETPFVKNNSSTSFSGGVGVALEDSLVLLLGGVNKEIFEEALNRNHYLAKNTVTSGDSTDTKLRKAAAEYMHHPVEWYKFNDEVWLYNSASNSWKSLGKYPQAALAGASAVKGDNYFYLVNGEIKPGIRTPKIWKIHW